MSWKWTNPFRSKMLKCCLHLIIRNLNKKYHVSNWIDKKNKQISRSTHLRKNNRNWLKFGITERTNRDQVNITCNMFNGSPCFYIFIKVYIDWRGIHAWTKVAIMHDLNHSLKFFFRRQYAFETHAKTLFIFTVVYDRGNRKKVKTMVPCSKTYNKHLNI